jgi:hypothetical protein
MKLKNKLIKFDAIKRLRTTLQFCKVSTPFEVEKREKKREEKIIARAPLCPDG